MLTEPYHQGFGAGFPPWQGWTNESDVSWGFPFINDTYVSWHDKSYHKSHRFRPFPMQNLAQKNTEKQFVSWSNHNKITKRWAPRHWVPPPLCPAAPDEIAPAARAATAATRPCSPARVPQRCWCARGGHLLAMLLKGTTRGLLECSLGMSIIIFLGKKGWESKKLACFLGHLNWQRWKKLGYWLDHPRTDPPMNKGLGTMGNANVKIRCVLSVCMVQPQSENIQGSFFFMTSPVDP